MLIPLRNILIGLLGSFLCIACNQVIYFPIDVKVPAEIDLPKNKSTILVVDNLPQTISVKNRSEIHNQVVEHTYNVDSLGVLFKKNFADMLRDKGFCDNVLYSTYSIAQKTTSTDTIPLPVDTVKKLANDVFADLIFSVDILDVSTNYWSRRVDFFNYEDSLETNVRVGINVFSSDGKRIIPTVETSNSLLWKVDLKTIKRKLFLDEELQYTALKASVNQIANLVSNKFISQWETTDRCYYFSTNKEMLIAENYIQKSDWVNAAKTWGRIYDKETKDPKLAKLAFNIALANEMTDDIENAINWINIAKKYINKLSEEEKKRLEEYSKQLEMRRSEFKKLDQENQ